MAITTRKEFAALCGDDEKKINVWITRGKINTVPGNKKQINTEDPENAYFLAERRQSNGLDIGELKVVHIPGKIVKTPGKSPKPTFKTPKSAKATTQKQVKKPTKSPKQPIQKQPPVAVQREIAAKELVMKRKYDLQTAIQEQAMELKALQIQSEKIRLDKTAGNLLPVDLTSGVIERHANSILKTFEKGFERIAEIYSTMAGFAPGQRSEFLKECRMELGSCVSAAGQMAKEEIDTLVGNYAETLMRGQKKA